ncbi:uncharacterized protein N0V89_011354 [Didymosphaeria variabile]|uniref:4-coumarate-CoA ligase n=1 Tax=Didymosphaeria variabile TaxID=1932322 RepID=A0A9W9C5A0_9PLEO|nr:uncharacterized protein N0V89_011354 [Didymosphaeria variabile]KAJ4345225.1 hypothetical protein N0V89_011354 [Didymosphaeria variabile]
MPVRSRWTIPVPEESVQKWVFGSSFDALPDIKAYIDADHPDTRYLSLSHFRHTAKRIALGLQKAGLSPGDRALVFASNSIQYPALFMGIIMAGGIFTGASPGFGAAELAYQLKDSGARFIIAQQSSLTVAVEAASKVGITTDHLYSFDGSIAPAGESKSNGITHWSALLSDTAEAERFGWVEPVNPRETTCCLNYSSGTTGLPKGVEITHHAYIANGEAHVHMEMRKSLAKVKPATGIKTSICFMPMYHAAGQTVFAVNNPKMRVSTYIMPFYDLEKFLKHVEEWKVSSLGLVPQVVLQLAKSPLVARYNLDSVDDVVCGTAPLAPEISREFEQRIWPGGDNFVRQGWGMSELTCAGALWSYDDDVRTASVGELVPNASLRMRNSDGEVTEPNKPGEIWFSGPTVMKGYWRNSKATEEAVVEENGERWLRTGDVAYVDKYGPGAKIFIVDRLKELIKVRGFQVSPSELEGVLLDRDDIVDAGVVGINIEGGEAPRAYIVRRPGSDVTEKEIMDWMKKSVANYKHLRGGVVFVDSIPRSQVSGTQDQAPRTEVLANK